MTEDELKAFRMKRRHAWGRIIAVFSSLTAAAIMVFFVARMFLADWTTDRKVRATADSEREQFEAKVSMQRTRREEAPATFNIAPRDSATKPEVVDMSGPGFDPAAGIPRNTPAVDSPPPGPVAAAGPSGIENLAQKQTAIADVLRAFFKAGSVVEMLPLVRDAQRVGPMMDDYYQRSRFKRRTWKGIGSSIPVDEPGYRFAFVQAVFTDASPVNVVVEETDSGFLVDWESSVQYSEIGWREFLVTRPVQPKLLRVVASKADAGPGKTALSLRHPQETGAVIGRFDAADPRFRPLVEQLDLCKWKDVPVILRLNFPGPTIETDEVEIAGVEGKGWLILGDRSRGS